MTMADESMETQKLVGIFQENPLLLDYYEACAMLERELAGTDWVMWSLGFEADTEEWRGVLMHTERGTVTVEFTLDGGDMLKLKMSALM